MNKKYMLILFPVCFSKWEYVEKEIFQCGKHSIHSTDYEKETNKLKIKYLES